MKMLKQVLEEIFEQPLSIIKKFLRFFFKPAIILVRDPIGYSVQIRSKIINGDTWTGLQMPFACRSTVTSSALLMKEVFRVSPYPISILGIEVFHIFIVSILGIVSAIFAFSIFILRLIGLWKNTKSSGFFLFFTPYLVVLSVAFTSVAVLIDFFRMALYAGGLFTDHSSDKCLSPRGVDCVLQALYPEHFELLRSIYNVVIPTFVALPAAIYSVQLMTLVARMPASIFIIAWLMTAILTAPLPWIFNSVWDSIVSMQTR